MHGAVSIFDINCQVSEAEYPASQRSILLIFSPFDNEADGENRAFLNRVKEYHFHSGQNTACYCVGYSVYEPYPNKEFGPAVDLKDIVGQDSSLGYYYPKLFDEVRADIQRDLDQKWQYNGGIALLLFPVTEDRGDRIVGWDRAAVVSSNKLIREKGIFQTTDQMIRTVLNINEAAGGALVPDQLDPEVARKVFWKNVKEFGSKFGGDALVGAIGFTGD